MVTIMRNSNNVFTPIFTSTTGIGGYSLTSAPSDPSANYNEIGGDHIVAYDYDGSGHADHLVIYRPGTGLVWILQYNGSGVFSPVFQSTTGIGGFDLLNAYDKIITFDYDHTGRSNYLLVYRPGSKAIRILKHVGNVFSTVVQGTQGIGGFDLANTNDQVMSFDYEGTGKMDYLVLYRPGGVSGGNRAFWLVKHNAGTAFNAVYATQSGLPSFDLSQPQDRMFAIDYSVNGLYNFLFCYRPGIGLISIYQAGSSTGGIGFQQVRGSTNGIGGYPFQFNPSSSDGWIGDKAFAFDDQNHLGYSSFVGYAAGFNWIDVIGYQNATIGNYGILY
jgi:hypothetical protein